jgi:hypothetical protein
VSEELRGATREHLGHQQPAVDVHHGVARDDIPAGISIPIPGRSEDG